MPLVWMKCLRLSTSSPMSTENTSSAMAACSTPTFSRVRFCGSMVVPWSSSQSISPRPLRRWKSFLWVGLSAWNWFLAASSFRYTFSLPTTVEYSGGWPM